MAEGDELPPVVAALTGDDASFREMLERDVALAAQFKADLEAALSGAGEVTAPATGAELFNGNAADLGEQAEASAQAAQDAYEGMALSVEESLALVDEAGQAMFEQLGATAREVATTVDAEAASLGDLQTELDGTIASIDEAVTAMEGLQGSLEEGFAAVESGASSAEEALNKVYAAMEAAKTVSAETAAAMKSSMGSVNVGGNLAGLQAVSTAYKEAAAAALEFGTSEAQLGISLQVLSDAEAELTDQQARLMQSFLIMSRSVGDDSIEMLELRETLAALSDAQAQVVASTQAVVAAQTEVNLAVVRNETALDDEMAALRGLSAAAAITGTDMSKLAAQIEEGNFKTLTKAATDAQATITSVQLGDAQQRLAAANLTLADTYGRLSAGEAVSVEEMAAVSAAAKKAAAEVAALDGSAAKAGAGMGGMGGGSMIAWMGLSYLPQGIQELEKLGGSMDHTALGANNVEEAMLGMSTQSKLSSASLDEAAGAASFLANISGGKATQGVQDVNTALTQLYQTDPQEAAVQVAGITAAMEKQGTSAATVQTYLQGYNTAVQNAAIQLKAEQHALEDTTPGTKAYSDQVAEATVQLAQSALQTQETNTATAQYGSQLLATERSATFMKAAVAAGGVQLLVQANNTQIANEASVQYGDKLLEVEQSQQYMNAAVGAAGVQMELATQSTEVTNLAMVAYGESVMGAYRDATTFNAALDASNMSMQVQAQSAAMSSVGLLGLGDDQRSLNDELVTAEQSYTEAQQGAQAYAAAVTALNGTYSTLYGAEAAFTGALVQLTTSLKSNGSSLDENSTKGYQNAQAAKAVADAAVAASSAVYQNEVSTKGSTVAWNDANATLAKQKKEFIDDAEKAGANKNAVKALADQLFKLPKSIKTDLHLDDSSVTHALSATQELITALKDMPATSIPVIGTRAVPGKASGGDVAQGQLYRINEDGGEGYFVPPANGYVVPHMEMAQLTPAYAGASGGGGGAPQVTVHVYLNGSEISAEMRAEVQQYKTHNSTTGFN